MTLQTATQKQKTATKNRKKASLNPIYTTAKDPFEYKHLLKKPK